MEQAQHYPQGMASQMVGVQSSRGGYLQVEVAISDCTCGEIHASVSDPGAWGMSYFWLGVKYAQLNKWTDIGLVESGATTFKEGAENAQSQD